MDQKLFRKLVKWYGILIVIHLFAMLVFGLFFSNEMSLAAVRYQTDASRSMVFWFSFAVILLFNITYSRIFSSIGGEHRREVVGLSRGENFSLNTYFFGQIKELSWMIGVYLIFQLPFTIFYAIFGFAYINTTLFEQFFIFDAGMYVLTGSAFAGFLLNAVLFAISLLGTRYLVYLSWVREKIDIK